MEVDKIDKFRSRFPEMVEELKRDIKFQLETRGRALIDSMLGSWQTDKLAQTLEVRVTNTGVEIVLGNGLSCLTSVYFGADLDTITPRCVKALGYTLYGRKFTYDPTDYPGQKARRDILDALYTFALKVSEDSVEQITKVIMWA
ncbi:MAG: hypothetical protein ACTSWA_08495 [Candidatus Thorarchaeota archaeon]